MLLSPFSLYLVLFCVGATATLLRFENGAYKDVIVAFDRSSVRNKEQIHNLEKLIKVASRELYVATQGLAYFKQVIIINVTRDNEAPDIHENIIRRSRLYSRADIRIASTITEHGTPDAFTIQAGECGEQGKFILISDSLFRNLEQENATKLAARRLVQEWVRYRYGVFDELPTWGEQSFVWKGKKLSPATCAVGIRGWAMTEEHERCVLECERVKSTCRFFPNPKRSSGVKSSMMSLPELPNAKFFCNMSTHDRKAPSTHNRMCNSKSIMEVIREHDDFKDANRWLKTTMEGPPEETSVIYEFDSERKMNFVFAVESSERMEKENGTQLVQDFIERFFVHLAPRRSRASFIKFSDESKTIWKGVPVGNESRWRDDSILNVSTRVELPSAPPDIGKALDDIYEKYSGGFPTIILISTGDDKFDEVEQYKQWEDKKAAAIHSISVGRNLSWKLDRLSQKHGGDSYFLGDTSSRGIGEPLSFNLDMAFLASMQSIAEDHEQPAVISYERFTLKNKGERYKHSFRVDHPIGRSLVISLSPNYTIYELTAPQQDPQPNKTHQYGFGSIVKSIIVHYAQPGRWTLELWQDSKEGEQHVDVLITARPRSDVHSSWVWAHAWITNVTEDKKGNGTKGYHRIFAEVKKGYSPVIDATVIATVQIMDQQNPIKVTLKDNGAVPDVSKEDGIYTNFFPVTNRTAGRPIVIVRVTNENRTAWVKTSHWKNCRSTHGMLDAVGYQRAMKEFGKSKKRFPQENFTTYSCCQQRKDTERICSMRLPLFERVTMANSPVLFPLSEAEVLKTPPAAVWDLKVEMEFMREGEFIALLQWTSSEHPRPNTKVKAIQVFGSTDHNSMLLKKFTSANIIHTLKNISPAGDVQSLEINITKSMVEGVNGTVRNLYLALRAEDQDGNAGGMSNIAEASFERFGEGEDDQDDDESDQDEQEVDQDEQEVDQDAQEVDQDAQEVDQDEQEVDQDAQEVDQDAQESNEEEVSTTWVTWTVGASVSVFGVLVVGAVACLVWRKKRNATEASEESQHSH